MSDSQNQITPVASFQELISTPFRDKINAMYWKRTLQGDFAEIVKKLHSSENIISIDPRELLKLQLSNQGQLARETLIEDLKILETIGASPILNLIKNYERDEEYLFFPTDVYSFHVDRSTVPTETLLCTYYGETSEIVPNQQAIQKIRIPEIRFELKKLYNGEEGQGFEDFLKEYFFDLHYQAKPNAQIIRLGLGHLWKIAVDYPETQIAPCIHRAPIEKKDDSRLLLIC